MAPSARLELRTLEPAVFLRPATATDQSAQPLTPDGDAAAAAGQVRALLTLHCTRAVKIRSIRLNFVGSTHSIWPDTSAPRAPRLDLDYDHVVVARDAALFDARLVNASSKEDNTTGSATESPLEKGLRRLSIRPSRSKSGSRPPPPPLATTGGSTSSTAASTPGVGLDLPNKEGEYFPPDSAPPSYTSYAPSSESSAPQPLVSGMPAPRSRAGSVRFDARASTSPPLSPRATNTSSKSLSGMLRALDKSQEKEEPDSRTFSPGTYEFPINISLPGGLPPTLRTMTGWTKYVLKATVERVGALTPNMSTEREIVLVQAYDEVLDPIVVQRTWEESLTYMAVISGRSFAIGSSIPLWIKFVPQAKVAIVRISVALEERTSYIKPQPHACRHEVPQRWPLLKLQGTGTDTGTALLPPPAPDTLDSLQAYLCPDQSDEVVARTLDPLGPWELAFTLPVPQEANISSAHKESTVRVTHCLRLTFRVQRLSSGLGGPGAERDKKRGMYDIVIEAPLIIAHALTAEGDGASLPNYSHRSPTAHDTASASLSPTQRDTVDRWLALGQAADAHRPPPPPYPADVFSHPVVSDDQDHWD